MGHSSRKAERESYRTKWEGVSQIRILSLHPESRKWIVKESKSCSRKEVINIKTEINELKTEKQWQKTIKQKADSTKNSVKLTNL